MTAAMAALTRSSFAALRGSRRLAFAGSIIGHDAWTPEEAQRSYPQAEAQAWGSSSWSNPDFRFSLRGVVLPKRKGVQAMPGSKAIGSFDFGFRICK